ncbi:MAG: hypothetical protein JW709_02110, partial [Sedimentisphaerales bacterium]|nr:hypothetical protein [Sedimentisphaerales bacterium]
MRKITVFMLTAACLACGECRSAASRIIQIAASDDKLIFDISAAETDVRLLEIKLNDPYDPQGDYAVLWRGKESDKISVDRFVDKKDRLYGRYILVDMAGEPVGNSRFITDLSQTTRGQLKLPRPKEKKGLSCIVNVDDAVKLGVKYMNDNLSLDMIVDLNNPNPELVYHFDDINIPINMAYIRNIDKKVKACSDAGISIFMVFANRFNKNVDRSGPLLHPRTDVKNAPMGLGAFNMASEEGIKYYIGVLEFLAQRYSRPDRKYGIISSYIIGNELQAHWTWHNMGLTGQDTVIREYLLSVRLAWLALQKYHADLRVYISLEHHWAIGGRMGDPLKEIPGKTILEKFNTWAKAEGDFPWNLAFHPYPENLFEPRFWR